MGYGFFGEKIIFPSAPVPNNDQSLKENYTPQHGCPVCLMDKK